MIKDNTNLSDLITGSLLGDGSVNKSFDKRQDSYNYYYSESHGSKQLDYLKWKMSFFTEEGFKARINSRDRKSSIGTREVAGLEHRFHIYGNKVFEPLRSYWYPGDVKQVPHDINLTPFSLAVWYMDDGSYDVHRGKIEISTYGFDLQSHKVLQRKLSEEFDIHMSIPMKKRKGKKYYYCYLPRSEAWKFLSLTEPFKHEDLLCKWPRSFMLHSLPKERKQGKYTISTKLPVEEARAKVISNLQEFWQTVENDEGFPIVEYLYWEKSYSQKPIQRLFGSFKAALLNSNIPGEFI